MRSCRLSALCAAFALVAVQTGDHGAIAALLGLLPIAAVVLLVRRGDGAPSDVEAAILWLRRRLRRPARRRAHPALRALLRDAFIPTRLPALANTTRGPPA